MTVRLYFEKLSPGLKAKLDARYRVNTDRVLRVNIPNGSTRPIRNYFGISIPTDTNRTSHGRLS
jgi:hypothetical protein